MRFFSSSAFARAPKLRFAASCSAAETMFRLSPAAPQAVAPGGTIGRRRTLFGARLRYVHCSIVPIARDKRAMTQMLRRLAFFLLGRGQDLHRAAGLLNRRDR